jgi:hypothetical protein
MHVVTMGKLYIILQLPLSYMHQATGRQGPSVKLLCTVMIIVCMIILLLSLNFMNILSATHVHRIMAYILMMMSAVAANHQPLEGGAGITYELITHVYCNLM